MNKLTLILNLISRLGTIADMYYNGDLTDDDVEIDLDSLIILKTPPEELRARGIPQSKIDKIINKE